MINDFIKRMSNSQNKYTGVKHKKWQKPVCLPGRLNSFSFFSYRGRKTWLLASAIGIF